MAYSSYHTTPGNAIVFFSSTIDGNAVNMGKDGDSNNAFSLLTVINTRGFDLPQTGSYGNWMFPVIGLSIFSLSMVGLYFLFRKKKSASM